MDHETLLAESDALYLYAQCLSEELRQTVQRTRAIRAETQRLRSLAHQVHLDAVCIPVAPPANNAPLLDAKVIERQDISPHDAALQVLREMRLMLDAFPIEWQVGIVKALTARTILVAREQVHPPQALTA
jgi:hypothetical protein